jgi:hypothetical protein
VTRTVFSFLHRVCHIDSPSSYLNGIGVAPPPTGKKGAPRKDGAKLQPKDSTTHGEPDGMWSGPDEKGRPVEVTWWKRMHVKQARWLEVTVLRVVRSHATNKEESVQSCPLQGLT